MARLVVDIGTATVRMLVPAGLGDFRWGSIDSGAADQYDRGAIQDAEAVTQRYRRLLESLRVRRGMSAVVLVPSAWAVGDLVDVPRGLPRSKVAPALRSLALKKLGGMDTLHIQTAVVRRQPHLQAFAVGVLREAVRDHMNVLAACGVRVERVELHTLALARLRAIHTGLVVVAEPDLDSVLTLRGGQPEAVYAREVLPGAPETERVHALLTDVQTLTRGTNITPVVALAGAAATPTMVAALNEAGVHALVLHGGRVPRDFPVTEYLPALGALRGRAGRVPLLELDPSAAPLDVRKAPARIAWALCAAGMLAAGNAAVYRDVYAPKLLADRVALARVSQVGSFREATALANQYRTLQAQLKTLQGEVAALHPTAFPWAAVAASLTHAASGVTVTTVQEAAGSSPGAYTLTIGGTAPTIGPVNAFVSGLPPAFTAPALTSVAVSNGAVQFHLRVTYGGGVT